MTGGHGGADTREDEQEGDDELHDESSDAVGLGELTAGAESHLGHVERGMGGGGVRLWLGRIEDGRVI